MEITKGKRYTFKTHKGATLAVRVDYDPHYSEYNGIKWIGIAGYRVRKDAPNISFGYESSWLVRADRFIEELRVIKVGSYFYTIMGLGNSCIWREGEGPNTGKWVYDLARGNGPSEPFDTFEEAKRSALSAI